ncbi:MAG: BACON domain-containing protein [Alistipes sp.]|nr:BACON domain-containing protein [Alistipes sp.]
MKQLLSLCALIALSLFTACEQGEGKNATKIEITTPTAMSFSSGNGAGIVKYNIINPTKDGKIEATADVAWISDFDYKDEGVIRFDISANPLGEVRTGVITISYGAIATTVSVAQEASENPSDKKIAAEMVVGQYYGTATPGYINYYIAFSDKGMSSYEPALGVNYWNVPNAYYYILDLMCDMEHTPANDKFNVPDGVYSLASGGLYNSINSDTSWLQYNDEAGWATSQNQIAFATATLTVEGTKLTLVADMFIGERLETHTVTYEGDYELVDMTSISY